MILNLKGGAMATYQTEQKKALADCLSRHAHQTALSCDEALSLLAQDKAYDVKPGKSTVYRLLSQMVEEGLVQRTVVAGKRQARFRWVLPECSSHLHLKCTNCQRLIHLEASLSKMLKGAVEAADFVMDIEETLILGRCKSCVERGEYE
jgi:Fe2+ or Zn2+ uptake regulation protein